MQNLDLKIITMYLMCSGPAAATQTPSSKPTTDPTKYNVPEYYQHNSYSFYDVDMSMASHRLAQPSKFDPLVPKT